MTNTIGKKSNKKLFTIVGAVAGLLIAGGVVAAVLANRGPTAPPPNAPVKDILKFAATDAWAKLPPDQLQKYYDEFDKMSWPDRMKAMQEAQNLSEEERRKAMENFWGTLMVTQARAYARLSPEEQKKELDKQIDQQQGMFRGMPTSRPTSRPGEGGGGRGGPGGGGWNNPSAQKDRLERMAPGDRAAMAKYIADLSQRRAERGISGGGWGGGGGQPRPR